MSKLEELARMLILEAENKHVVDGKFQKCSLCARSKKTSTWYSSRNTEIFGRNIVVCRYCESAARKTIEKDAWHLMKNDEDAFYDSFSSGIKMMHYKGLEDHCKRPWRSLHCSSPDIFKEFELYPHGSQSLAELLVARMKSRLKVIEADNNGQKRSENVAA
jgi:hypothetical protein